MRTPADAAGAAASAPAPDTMCVLAPRFSVPPHLMGSFKAGFQGFFDHIKPKECGMHFFGFTVDEANHMVLSREAYANADGLLAHLANVEAPLAAALKIGEMVSLEVHAPLAEVERLREKLAPLGCTFYVRDPGGKLYEAASPKEWGTGVDDHAVLVVPRYKVPKENMQDFRRKFYAGTQAEEHGLLYSGFSADETNRCVVCHEAFRDAECLLSHLANADPDLAELESMEVHGPAAEIAKLRIPLAARGCRYFYATQPGSKTWMFGPGVPFPPLDGDEGMANVDVIALLRTSANRMIEQMQAKVDKGSRTRTLVEERVASFSDKAKDFVVNEMNSTARALLKAIDDEDASLVLAFNEALEVSMPPLSVILAGIMSPALLQAQFINHLIQLLVLFWPAFLGTAISLVVDYGVVCDIPGMRAWTCTAFVLSGMLVVSHTLLLSQLSNGVTALRKKSQEVQERLIENAADGETDLSDMQEIVVGGTVLIQEALLVEDGLRRSKLNDIIGVCSSLWFVVVVWNFVLVIGWTFVPGQISFYTGDVDDTPQGAFCGQWASVFVARLICILTPVVFFLNIAGVVYWAIGKVLGSKVLEGALLGAAKSIDDGNAGVPLATIVTKALVLRAAPDAERARLAVALGEALRLTKMRQGLEQKLDQVQSQINRGKLDRKRLKTLVRDHGDGMEEQLQRLEKAGAEDTVAWKEKGAELALAAQQRAEATSKVVTAELDKVVQQITELAEEVKNSQAVKDAVEKAQQAVVDARAAAEQAAVQAQEAARQAQEAAQEGLAQAKSGIEAGIAYAQSDEVQAALAQAQAQASAGLAQAQSSVEAGIAYAQSDEVQAALAQAQDQARGMAAQAQAQASAGLTQAQRGVETGLAYAQSDAALAALAQVQEQAKGMASQAQSGLESGIASAQSQSEEARAAIVQAAGEAKRKATGK
uniref:ABM domain-containing protein n=1 Tax=Zooxanthella nutricula TaxID=1333877 RepID=A0A7S2IV82_9DINO